MIEDSPIMNHNKIRVNTTRIIMQLALVLLPAFSFAQSISVNSVTGKVERSDDGKSWTKIEGGGRR